MNLCLLLRYTVVYQSLKKSKIFILKSYFSISYIPLFFSCRAIWKQTNGKRIFREKEILTLLEMPYILQILSYAVFKKDIMERESCHSRAVTLFSFSSHASKGSICRGKAWSNNRRSLLTAVCHRTKLPGIMPAEMMKYIFSIHPQGYLP